MGRTSDRDKILKNGAMVLVGYLPAALIVLVWSNAAPSIGIFVVIIAIAFLALMIGSQVLRGVNQQGRQRLQ